MKYLFLITQNDATGYDTYDSAVVVAKNPDEARKISPWGQIFDQEKYVADHWSWSRGFWARTPDLVTATLIGVSEIEPKESPVICASFNAG